MGKLKCLVPDCRKLTNKYTLPKNVSIRAEWLRRCGVAESETNQFAKICPRHFHRSCAKEGGKRLLKFSVPSLFIDYVQMGNEGDNFMFPRSDSPSDRTPKTIIEIYRTPSPKGNTNDIGCSGTMKVLTPTKTYSRKRRLDFDIIETSPATEISPKRLLLDVGASTSSSSLVPTSLTSPAEAISLKSNMERPKRRQRSTTIKRLNEGSVANVISFFDNSGAAMDALREMNEVTLKFFASNLMNQGLLPRGRRYTIEDKILALALYKHGPRAYRFLSKYFCLPSRKSLSKILNNVPFLPGLNPNIFRHLGLSVGKLEQADRRCILMFDEVALKPRLHYNQQYDCVEGFVDLGIGMRQSQFADHALVFMAKGVKTAWKQPVFFGFCEGTTKSDDLVRCIKSLVLELQGIGLEVIATICDQGPTNRAAINKLTGTIKDGPLLYTIGGQEIVHIFDPPHLLKGVRNGLLKKDLQFIENDSTMVASWAHIMRFYEMDQKQGSFAQCHKLSDGHVLPSRIPKMKVKNASQVFSQTLASALFTRVGFSMRNNLVESQPDYFDPQGLGTASLLLFFDKLFDSVNGWLLSSKSDGKPLRCVVEENSEHESFWSSAISILSSMSFVNENPNRPAKSYYPSIKNWISTVHGFLHLKKKLIPSLKFFSARVFNQDPLENFFSQIRSHASGDANCSSFISSYKTILVSGLTSSHSVGANCEDDESSGPLSTLKTFVNEQFEFEYPEVLGEISLNIVPEALCTDFASDYVAGAVTSRFLRRFSCNSCKERLCSSQELPEHLRLRQYEGRHLLNPSEVFSFVLNQVTVSILEILPSIIHKYRLKNIILTELKNKNYTFLLCDEHMEEEEKQTGLLNIIINIVLFNYIKKINRVLKGNDLRLIDSDDLFRKAHKKYQKHSHQSR